jgi:hypothetical protein
MKIFRTTAPKHWPRDPAEDMFPSPYIRIETYPVSFRVSTVVTMKNIVFCDIKSQFVPHGKHITSPLQSAAS